MKKNVVFTTILISLIQFSAQCFSQTVIPHPVPDEFVSNQYSVEVNGKPVQVFEASPRVHFASFEFTGKANVKVNGKIMRELNVPLPIRKEQETGRSVWDGDVLVRPLSRNVKAQTNGTTATFTLVEPGQYSVEGSRTTKFDNDNKNMVLFLFANKPETGRPKDGDPNVIYLKPGIHQQNMDLKSGQTLYLEAGAVLFGGINVWDAQDVKILGHGVVFYYGPQSENHDTGNIHRKNWHPLTTHNSERLTVSGITFVARSRTWTIQMHTTFDADFDNVKVLGVNDQNVNGDGFDWFGGGRTRIKNSLVRSADDSFAFFPPGFGPEGEVKDVRIENCVIWPTRANIGRYGGGLVLKIDNIAMINCDVIHVPIRLFQVPRSLICTTGNPDVNKENSLLFSNILFENIRLEEPAGLLGVQNEAAVYRNIVFKDITIMGKPTLSEAPLFIHSTVDGLVFDHVTINGKLVSGMKDVPFSNIPGLITKEIKNLKFINTE